MAFKHKHELLCSVVSHFFLWSIDIFSTVPERWDLFFNSGCQSISNHLVKAFYGNREAIMPLTIDFTKKADSPNTTSLACMT